MQYTEEQLLAEWRLRLGLLTQECGCTVSSSDRGDLEALMRSRLRSWYESILLTADASLLPVEDVSGEVNGAEAGADGWLHFCLPDGCVRLLSVRLRGWDRPLMQTFPFDSPEASLALFPGLEPSASSPLALRLGRLMACSPAAPQKGDASGQIEQLLAIRATEGVYDLHPSLLDSLPDLRL